MHASSMIHPNLFPLGSTSIHHDKRGACAEMCDIFGCPAGWTCMSNGCGHQCQLIIKRTADQQRRLCPFQPCNIFCPCGQAQDDNGCYLCACATSNCDILG